MQNRWSLLWAAGVGSAWLGFAPEASAITAEQRFEKLERHILELERRLEASEAENQKLRSKKPASTSTASEPDVKALDQKVKILERKLEVEHEVTEANAKKTPRVEAGSAGFRITSPDGDHQLRLRGYVQADGNIFMDDSSGDAIADKFTIRRARLNFDGTLFKYADFRIAPDFGGGQSRLFDAYLDLHYLPFASLNVGKQKAPISLERLQSATALTFAERAYPTQLAPNRDVGVLLHGEFAKPGYTTQYGGPHNFNDFITYQLGVFNGARDNGFIDTDLNDDFEFQGRVFAHPFQHSGIGPLEGLGLGVAGSWGHPRNETSIPGLTSPGQQRILRYSEANSTATATSVNGYHYRVYPQLYWYWGPFGLLSEYAISSQELRRSTITGPTINAKTRQDNTAWQVALSYVLTGEDSSFNGVKPRHAFNPFNGQWGAWQVAGRWSELDVDDDTFRDFDPRATSTLFFANPAQSVSKATSWALGLNWYLNNNVKVMADYEQTHFDGGAAGNGDRPTEKIFFTRFQFSY
ncbi:MULTISPECIES: OprO/OprP family phosphate-selective porin [Methylocaldum]|jgi:phosphate-selective porin OprO/OprP|uniref:OprO/OprP family phosphate-selective porin n=1 Tax=unclassified Methylocaldum TaxID=2622260 RepID=UPI000A325860|nr:porin [Methylocaldum sp. RMAD-M]MBP1149700.1 phosphate-selective porin OprO/OprP [Methylocaldum sp. RMAD-M]MVF24760.1 hypothetical protein [Methylocaldum sp. BRCS4]